MTKSFKSKKSFLRKKNIISQKKREKICLKSKNSIKNKVYGTKTEILNFDNILEILFSKRKIEKSTKEKKEKSIIRLI